LPRCLSDVRRTTQLRQLLAQRTVALPGAFNAVVAKLIEREGFSACYISGAGLANGAGLPDVGLLTLTEVVAAAKFIAEAVSLPCICDADTGFGEADNAARAVREFERAGIAGIHLEDQEFPKKCGHLEGKRLISVEAMCEKLAAAAAAKSDPDFLLIARTDARAIEGLAAAVDRARRYLAAGADAIFPEALTTKDEFGEFAAALQSSIVNPQSPILLANMTEFGKSPYLAVEEFEALGYRMVIFPMTAFRVMLRAVGEALAELQKSGTQQAMLDRMTTRQELYEILRYQG